MKSILLLASVYGSLVGGEFAPAPKWAEVDGAWCGTAHLTEAQANERGWKLLVDERPTCRSNEYAVAVGFVEDGRITRRYEIRHAAPVPRKFSKLKIYGAIAQTGAWDAVEAWLKAKTIGGVNGWTAFQLAQEVSEDHPLFAPLLAEARQLLGLDEAQMNALLDECILEE